MRRRRKHERRSELPVRGIEEREADDKHCHKATAIEPTHKSIGPEAERLTPLPVCLRRSTDLRAFFCV